MRIRANVTSIGLVLVAVVLVSGAVVRWGRAPAARPVRAIALHKTYSAEEATAIWRSMRPPQDALDIRGVAASGALQILADVNDDGVIDARDSAGRAAGASGIVRIDDAICNGRSGVYDRSLALDDDLQMIALQLPANSEETDELRLEGADDSLKNLVFYKSDLRNDDAVVHWPVKVSAAAFRDRAQSRVFLWFAAKDKFAGGKANGAVTIALIRGGQEMSRDTLPVVVVGKLGDKNYFAGALHYLMEQDRITGKPAKLFLDEVRCASPGADHAVETFQIVVMRQALTEMNVLETYYANRDPQRGRIQNIFDAMERNPDEDLIVNGSFFQLEKSGVNHGRRVLGAVVNNRTLSPASTPHFWQVAYRESGVPGTPDWRYKSFCLFQPNQGPGQMTLVEEPFSPKEPFVPKVSAGDSTALPYMALGGLHQVHEFENNPGCNIACMGFVDVPVQGGAASDPSRRLIWIAATETDPAKTTGKFGDGALRQALRDSGLTIEEGDPKHGVGPGRCDFVYFDSANSVALAYKVDGVFETPCVSGRHLPKAPNTLVNNYLMLRVTEAVKDKTERGN